MKIGLIGYGKMGKEIEQIILQEGNHSIDLIISENNLEDFTIENLGALDVALDFTRPEAAFDNVLKCFEANLPIVVGTTSWADGLEKAKQICKEQNQTLFTSPNFSIGVNLFFKLNQVLAQMMNCQHQYSASMLEIHHTQKVDTPSGTAINLAEDLIQEHEGYISWSLDRTTSSKNLKVVAERKEGVPGTHIVTYDSDVDFIEIKHEAKNRRGFAIGAIRAAEFIAGKKGFFTMEDLLKL
jgi:4-hydroxy-tetrahydrodipicolinate reductase